MYACDFFLMTPELMGPVDAVYDRGALEAVNPQERTAYVRVIQSLLGPDFRLVFNSVHGSGSGSTWIRINLKMTSQNV